MGANAAARTSRRVGAGFATTTAGAVAGLGGITRPGDMSVPLGPRGPRLGPAAATGASVTVSGGSVVRCENAGSTGAAAPGRICAVGAVGNGLRPTVAGDAAASRGCVTPSDALVSWGVARANGASADAISPALAKRRLGSRCNARSTSDASERSMSCRMAASGTGFSVRMAFRSAGVVGASKGLRPVSARYMHAPTE